MQNVTVNPTISDTFRIGTALDCARTKFWVVQVEQECWIRFNPETVQYEWETGMGGFFPIRELSLFEMMTGENEESDRYTCNVEQSKLWIEELKSKGFTRVDTSDF